MLIYRLEKGSPLSIEELDDNFRTLETRLEELAEKIALTRIGVSLDGDAAIFKNNGEPIGRVALPVFKPEFRGRWRADTAYRVGDWVFRENKLLACMTGHSSGETLDELNWRLIFEVNGAADA